MEHKRPESNQQKAVTVSLNLLSCGSPIRQKLIESGYLPDLPGRGSGEQIFHRVFQFSELKLEAQFYQMFGL